MIQLAFRAEVQNTPLNGITKTYGQPVDGVGVGGETSATSVLLVTGTVDDDGVLESSCTALRVSHDSSASIASQWS